MTGTNFGGIAAKALAMVETYGGDLELAAGHAVFEAASLIDLDPREARRWLDIAELLQGKEIREVGHA